MEKGKKRKKSPRLEELIPDASKREEVMSRLYKGDPIVGEGGIFTDMLQALTNAALEGEMDYYLKDNKLTGKGNRRNGHTRKTVRSRVGPISVHTPRDRNGEHEPILIKKWDRDLGAGMSDIIISLYARGNTVEDVRQQLRVLYGLEVSAGAISAITDRILPEIIEWQQRPLAPCYPIVYLDAIHYKVRENGKTISKGVYTVLGINADGMRDVLGLYLKESEGSRQWGLILEDLKERGVEDVFIFCVDGLKGFKQVIEEVYPKAINQRCIVHMVRNCTRFVSYKDLSAVCSDLRKIYTAADREQASLALAAFGERWDRKYKGIRPKWEEAWDELMAFMDYSHNIRRMIYTTNPVEALHRVMRKVTKTKGAWSNDKGLLKQLYLALMHNKKSWQVKALGWGSIQKELVDHFGSRYEKYL
jgi:transposase-like protein